MSIDRARRLEPRLPGLFDELAEAHSPDYLEAAIERASSGQQRPAWTFPARWLPVAIVTTRVPTTRLPWRALGVVALLALLLAMAILLAGSRSTRLPEPFGPAANGVIAVALDGDLYTVDPRTGEMTLLLGGPQRDEWIGFTPDGTRGVLLRWNPDNGAMTAARIGTIPLAGGAQPIFVQKDVLHGGEPIQIAPNGRELAFSAFDFGGPNVHISVAAIDGSSFRTFFDVPVVDDGGIAYLAPMGASWCTWPVPRTCTHMTSGLSTLRRGRRVRSSRHRLATTSSGTCPRRPTGNTSPMPSRTRQAGQRPRRWDQWPCRQGRRPSARGHVRGLAAMGSAGPPVTDRARRWRWRGASGDRRPGRWTGRRRRYGDFPERRREGVGARRDLGPRSANGWHGPPAAAGDLGCADGECHDGGLAVVYAAGLAAPRPVTTAPRCLARPRSSASASRRPGCSRRSPGTARASPGG